MATEVGMYSATHESVTMPVGRDEIIRTAPRTNQIAGSVTALSDKKKKKKESFTSTAVNNYKINVSMKQDI